MLTVCRNKLGTFCTKQDDLNVTVESATVTIRKVERNFKLGVQSKGKSRVRNRSGWNGRTVVEKLEWKIPGTKRVWRFECPADGGLSLGLVCRSRRYLTDGFINILFTEETRSLLQRSRQRFRTRVTRSLVFVTPLTRN